MGYEGYRAWCKELTLKRLQEQVDADKQRMEAAETDRSRAAWKKMYDISNEILQGKKRSQHV